MSDRFLWWLWGKVEVLHDCDRSDDWRSFCWLNSWFARRWMKP